LGLRLVVGLGNYLGSYDHTPHNIGFDAVDLAADKLGLDWREEKDYLLARAADESVTLLKPKTYMNTSGPAVKKAAGRCRANPTDLLVVYDDFALPWGRLRLRPSGSAGGHNGVASVIDALGTQDFPRLRVGVGPVPEGMDPKDYVLKKISKARLQELAAQAADAIATALDQGFDTAMNRFNAAPKENP